VTLTVADQAGVMQAIDRGDVRAGLVIPPHFAADQARGQAQTLFLVDGSDLFTSISAYNAAAVISQDHAARLVTERISRAGPAGQAGNTAALDVAIRVLYNPDMKDLWFIIPGILAMLLQTQSTVLTVVAVVRERETGTIEQILVSPIRPLELMLGKITPNILTAMFNLLTIMVLGVVWFKVPFQGSIPLFLALSLLFIFSGLGLGVLLSTVSQNMRQAMQLVMMISFLGLVLSGFIFPRYTMPAVVRWVGFIFPLTYFIPISRGIITKGIGLPVVASEVASLCVYIVVIVFLAARAFKQRLE
jgi:ABC-2 type transport system permease protein